MRFLALGDSYTIGEGLTAAGRWPVRLAARLRSAGIAIGEPQILATTGWTSDELLVAIDAATLTPPYALVTLLIGVNDQYRGMGAGAYAAGFGTLLQRAVALGDGDAARVIVVSIPDWGMTPFARSHGRDPAQVRREIDAFNAAAQAMVDRAHAHWVDITLISRAPDAASERVADGLHPNGAQYARWVDAILPVAQEAVGGARVMSSGPGTSRRTRRRR